VADGHLSDLCERLAAEHRAGGVVGRVHQPLMTSYVLSHPAM
jgi:hypothetical protein